MRRALLVSLRMAIVTIVLTAIYDIGIMLTWLPDPFPQWFFVAESLLLALFIAFWTLQTAHFWRAGVPDDAAGAEETVA